MIRDYIKNSIENFFLHIQINTANVPYWQLPRSRGSNLLSKAVRNLFEKNSIQRFFGINLVTAMMIIPLSGQINADVTQYEEMPLNIVVPETSEGLDSVSTVKTATRQFILPVERLRYVSTLFKAGHPGFDLNSYIGDDVYAFTSGVVYQVETGQFGLGKYIVLDHGHGLFSVYAHLQGFNVHVGQAVKTGDKIGEVGMTGFTTGPHVHFEVHDNGTPVSPGLYLDL